MKYKSLLFILPILLLTSLALAKDYEVSVDVSPATITVRPCEIATYDLLVRNLGNKKDNFAIFVEGIPEGWYTLSQDILTLEGKSSNMVYLFITADCYSQAATYHGVITALGKSNSTAGFTLNVVPDHAIKLTLPGIVKSCLCEEDEISATLENLGNFTEDVTIAISGNATDIVDLKTSRVTLQPHKTVEIYLEVKPVCEPDEKSYYLQMTAESKGSYAKSSAISTIKKIKCYDFDVIYPEELRTCANTLTRFNITVKNSGIRDDTYTLNIRKFNYTKSSSLKPNETGVFDISFKETEGKYTVEFIVEGKFVKKSGNMSFIVERCYGVDLLVSEKTLIIQAGKGMLISPEVKNIGTRIDSFGIFSNVKWVSIRPSNVVLEPNTSTTVYVYYSPEFGASGTYSTSLTAKSDHSEDTENITINIVKEAVPSPTTTPKPTTTPLPISTTTPPEVETTPPEVTTTALTPPTKPLFDILKEKLSEIKQSLLAFKINKILVSVVIGIIVALVILAILYFVIMRE